MIELYHIPVPRAITARLGQGWRRTLAKALHRHIAARGVRNPGGLKAAISTGKKVIRRPRRPVRSAERDRRSLRKLGLSRKPAPRPNQAVQGPLGPCTPSPSSTTSSTPAKALKSKRQKANENDKRRPPAYKNTTDIAKMISIGEAVAKSDPDRRPHAFSLHFGAEAHRRFAADPAAFKAWMKRRIDKAFAALPFPAPAYCAAFELSPSPRNRLHLHGLISCFPQEVDRISDALKAAATKWIQPSGAVRAEERQLVVQPCYCNVTWTCYSTKAAQRAAKALKAKSAIIASNELRSAAKKIWEKRRSKALRKTKPRTVKTDLLSITYANLFVALRPTPCESSITPVKTPAQQEAHDDESRSHNPARLGDAMGAESADRIEGRAGHAPVSCRAPRARPDDRGAGLPRLARHGDFAAQHKCHQNPIAIL